MKKLSIVLSMLVGFCSEIAAIQVMPAATVLGKVVFSPAVMAPVTGVAARLFSTRRLSRKKEERNSTSLQVIQENRIATSTLPVKTIAQLEEENRIIKLELEQRELKNKLTAHTIDGRDLDHAQQKAKLFSTYVSAAAEISTQVLMWSVRIFGFRTPFGGDRN